MSRWHKHEWDLLPARAFSPRPGGGMTLEGGKSSDVPAPDPRLVEAQLKSMGIQDTAIQQVMANVNRLAPVQEEQMRFGLDANRQALEQSKEDRGYALERRGKLSGLQDQLINEANSFNSEERREELASQAGADAEQAFDGQRASSMRAMARMGINPSSPRFQAANRQAETNQAAIKAGMVNATRRSAREEARGLTDRATNAMAGYPSMSMQANGQGAQLAAGGINMANAGVGGMNAGSLAASQAAGGMGNNATSMFNAQGQYKLGSDRQAADNDPFASLLGAGTQLAVASISDRRLKTDINQVGFDERTGLHLYEFAYLDGSGKRYRGVMADEVRERFPEAVFEMPDGFMAVNYHAIGLDMVEVEGATQ